MAKQVMMDFLEELGKLAYRGRPNVTALYDELRAVISEDPPEDFAPPAAIAGVDAPGEDSAAEAAARVKQAADDAAQKAATAPRPPRQQAPRAPRQQAPRAPRQQGQQGSQG